MTGWDNVVVSYNSTGKILACPFCKADSVVAEKHVGKIRDSITLTCKKCNRSAHYDGVMKQPTK